MFNGRPMALADVVPNCGALVETWHLDIAAGDAIVTVSVMAFRVRQSNQVTIVFSSKQRCHRLCCPSLAIRQYSSVGRRAAQNAVCRKSSTLNEKIFPFWKSKNADILYVFQVMRQTKRENIPFQKLLYPDWFVYSSNIATASLFCIMLLISLYIKYQP